MSNTSLSDPEDDLMDRIARRALEQGPGASSLPIVQESTETVVPLSRVRDRDQPDYAEHLSNLLEQNCSMLRRNMMDFFRDARASFLKEQREAVDAERRSAQQTQKEHKQNADAVREQLAGAQMTADKADGLVWRACTLISHLREQQRERSWLAAWRREEWHLRRSLRTMWANVARKKKTRVDERVAAACAQAAAKVTQEKDEEAESLRMQLLETKRALAAEKHAREALAADMKRSFMRGVCALNMEAMQVMKRGQAPNGMNPNPTMFPIDTSAASETGDPEPEAVPDTVYKHLQASMSGSGGLASDSRASMHTGMPRPSHSPAFAAPPTMQHATTKQGSAMSGYVVRESFKAPSPGAHEAPRTAPLAQLQQFKNRP